MRAAWTKIAGPAAALAVALLLAGCFAGSTEETRAVLVPDDAKAEVKAEAKPAKEDVKAGKAPLGGMAMVESALAKAKGEGKLVMLKFTAEWCGPCQDMKKAIDAGRFTKQLDKMVFVEVDSDLEANAPVYEKYHPEGAIPFVLVLRPDGSRVDEVLGYDTTVGFEAFLEGAIRKAG